jgi:hypothetical protein
MNSSLRSLTHPRRVSAMAVGAATAHGQSGASVAFGAWQSRLPRGATEGDHAGLKHGDGDPRAGPRPNGDQPGSS